MKRRVSVTLFALALVAVACGDGGPGSSGSSTQVGTITVRITDCFPRSDRPVGVATVENNDQLVHAVRLIWANSGYSGSAEDVRLNEPKDFSSYAIYGGQECRIETVVIDWEEYAVDIVMPCSGCPEENS